MEREIPKYMGDQGVCVANSADNQLQICSCAVQTDLRWSVQLFLDHRPSRPQIQRSNAKCVQNCNDLSPRAVFNKTDL